MHTAQLDQGLRGFGDPASQGSKGGVAKFSVDLTFAFEQFQGSVFKVSDYLVCALRCSKPCDKCIIL